MGVSPRKDPTAAEPWGAAGGGRGSSDRSRNLLPPSPPLQLQASGEPRTPPRWPLQPGKTRGDEARMMVGGGGTQVVGMQTQVLWGHACGDKDGDRAVPWKAWSRGWCAHEGSAPRTSRRARRRRRLLPFTRGGQITSELHPCKY